MKRTFAAILTVATLLGFSAFASAASAAPDNGEILDIGSDKDILDIGSDKEILDIGSDKEILDIGSSKAILDIG